MITCYNSNEYQCRVFFCELVEQMLKILCKIFISIRCLMDHSTIRQEGFGLILFNDDSQETSTVSSMSSLNNDIKDFVISQKETMIRVTDAPLRLQADEKSGFFDAEKDEGNIEYKWKLVGLSIDRIEHLTTQMNFRLREGEGHAYYLLGVEDDGCPRGLDDEDLSLTIRTVYQMGLSLGCEVFIQFVREGLRGKISKLFLRRSSEEEKVKDLRICCVGNAESGKSTLLGVLLSGKLDDGNGSARMDIFRHRHELEKGSTSSLSRQILGFSSSGEVVNHDTFTTSWSQIVKESEKLIMFIDLAGHERYMKTTLFGLTSQSPDYALVTISPTDREESNLTRTKGLLDILSGTCIPFFIVITKRDDCSLEYLQDTIAGIGAMLQSLRTPHSFYEIIQQTDFKDFSERFLYKSEVPVFAVSSVLGTGLELLTDFFRSLRKPYDWDSHVLEPFEFCIDEIFQVEGVGTVVNGIVLRGTISVGDVLVLGPFPRGEFVRIRVSSIHVYRTSTQRAFCGQPASLAIGKINRSVLRKGMALVDPNLHPVASISFEAEVSLIEDSQELQVHSEPVLHLETIHQSARIISFGDNCLQLNPGESGIAVFRFCHHPEYVRVGNKFLFRHGYISGFGLVTRLVTSIVLGPS